MMYEQNTFHSPVSPDTPPDHPVLAVLTPAEALDLLRNCGEYRLLKRSLAPDSLHSCKAELLPGCILGTLAVPDKKAPLLEGLHLAYYLDRNRLFLIAEESQHPALTARLSPDEPPDATDPARLFFSFLEALFREDMMYLQNFERRLSTLEDSLPDTLPRELLDTVLTVRRELLVFHSYYQQMRDLCELLFENEHHFFSDPLPEYFDRLGRRIDRLYDHTQTLREYALQIREMHQSLMDVRQNETMRMLTVISTVFFPLSLITGWYGMNFSHMPELDAPFAYFILIGICLVIVTLEIWYFKKKGWF